MMTRAGNHYAAYQRGVQAASAGRPRLFGSHDPEEVTAWCRGYDATASELARKRAAAAAATCPAPDAPNAEEWHIGWATASQGGARSAAGGLTRRAAISAWYAGYDACCLKMGATPAQKHVADYRRLKQQALQASHAEAAQRQQARPLKWG